MHRRAVQLVSAVAAACLITGCAGAAGGQIVNEQLETGERTVERVEDSVDDINDDQDDRQQQLDDVTDEAG